MTLLTVSNQGFTIHNHICGINFLSHLRGAPQNPRQNGMGWDAVGYPGRGRDGVASRSRSFDSRLRRSLTMTS